MPTLKWNRPKDQTFEAGLDRGVLYLEPTSDFPEPRAVSWSGLVNVEDSGSSEVKAMYRDGQKFLVTMTPREWEGSLEAYTFPDEFNELIGIKKMGDGLYVDSQVMGRFGLSYRTMVSTPNTDSEIEHYKIHLIYTCMAEINGRSYSTLSASGTDPTTFKFNLSAVPQKIPGARPTAHIILDTRDIDPEVRVTLEEILYGKYGAAPYLPTIEELIDLLHYGDTVVVVENFYTAPEPLPNRINPATGVQFAYGDSKGTWTATGSTKNIQMIENPFTPKSEEPNWDFNTYFQIDNVDATKIADPWQGGSTTNSKVYEFNADGTIVTGFRLASDADGTPYYEEGAMPSNAGIDTDTTPYYGPGENAATINQDTDGNPYYDPN
jgi:hypothetical protein